jgi:hypothetical protein
MNLFIDLLKKNKILPELDFSRDRIAQALIGQKVVSPLPPTNLEKAMDVAKNIGAYSAAQVATDIPKAFTGAVNISPPVELAKRLSNSYLPTEQLGYARDALAPIGYLANPLKAVGAGAGNVALQSALQLLQGQKLTGDVGGSFASGFNAAGPALALLPLLKAFASKTPDTTQYIGDPLPPSDAKWIQKGNQLLRDMRYGKRVQYAGK